MSLFTRKQYITTEGKVIDLPIGVHVDKRGGVVYRATDVRYTLPTQSFMNQDHAVEHAMRRLRYWLERGHSPCLRKRRDKVPLPCGQVFNHIGYCEQLTRDGQISCRFTVTYPDIEKDKAVYRHMYIGLNVSASDPVYHNKLAEIIQFAEDKRQEYKEEFIKRIPSIVSQPRMRDGSPVCI